MQKGTITIEIDPITPEETERIRGIFLLLIQTGGLSVKSGSTTLHFDLGGLLQKIEVQSLRTWKRQTNGKQN